LIFIFPALTLTLRLGSGVNTRLACGSLGEGRLEGIFERALTLQQVQGERD
jgi:hypothetical protein